MKKSKISKRKARKSQHILRPRTAFNFFYSHQRDVILNERSRASTTKEMNTNDNDDANDCVLLRRKSRGKSHNLHHPTKIVAKRWKEVSNETRKKFEILAEKDRIRYSKAIMSSQKPKQECSTSDATENHIDSTRELRITKQVQIFDGHRTCSKPGKVADIHDDLKDDESASYNTMSHLKSTRHPGQYTDRFGITWSTEELDILKTLS